MRNFIAIVLLVGFLFQTTAKLAIILNFKANQEYIAKNLCVNRQKPKSSCKGSCQLKKKLKEEEKNEVQLPGGIKDKFEILPCTIQEEEKTVFDHLRTENNFLYKNNYAFICGTSIFHPPNLTS